MAKGTIFSNIMYNSIYTGLNFLFPLLIAPYVSRILGADNLGIVNLANALVSWFILLASFGIPIYGVREISKSKNNHEKLSQIFSELVVLNGIISLFVIVTYLIIISTFSNFSSELSLYLIMSMSILLNIFSIDWFYQGIEEFRYITIRNIIVKFISLICTFTFIRNTDDYLIYGLIGVLVNSLNSVLNFFVSKKYVRLRFKNLKPFRHIKKLWVFFLHRFIVNIYTNLDQLLLGLFVDTKSVAFMNRGKVVVNMAMSVSNSISNVTLPRASYYKDKDDVKFRTLMAEVPKYILFITIPITTIVMIMSPNIMYIIGGIEFLPATPLLQLISLTIVLSPLSNYLQQQVLVASGNEKIGLSCSIFTSFLSLFLNIILIPKFGFIGAALVQLLAEFSAVGSRYIISKHKLKYKEIRFITKSTLIYFCSAIIMGLILTFSRKLIDSLIYSFFIGTPLGLVTYTLILILTREQVTLNLIRKFRVSHLRE